mmetsp:Transcript_14486/g.30419  ORF Transcript_14486/g.30419 Transcript_14486/m.30419 type:complete len:216 (-) Transcript_14486:306-953(-)
MVAVVVVAGRQLHLLLLLSSVQISGVLVMNQLLIFSTTYVATATDIAADSTGNPLRERFEIVRVSGSGRRSFVLEVMVDGKRTVVTDVQVPSSAWFFSYVFKQGRPLTGIAVIHIDGIRVWMNIVGIGFSRRIRTIFGRVIPSIAIIIVTILVVVFIHFVLVVIVVRVPLGRPPIDMGQRRGFRRSGNSGGSFGGEGGSTRGGTDGFIGPCGILR